MQVRLAFSVMIQVDADVLLIDEVLAVGDAAFQQKCFDVFNRIRDEGRTVLFVTHDMGAVRRYCHRAMLLERGAMRASASPIAVGDHYVELNFGRDHFEAGVSGEEVGQRAPGRPVGADRRGLVRGPGRRAHRGAAPRRAVPPVRPRDLQPPGGARTSRS